MNAPVNFEIAKFLKEKEFNKPCKLYYKEDKKLYEGTVKWINSMSLEMISAPTITDVVMWLYEKHGIWISVVPYNDEELSQTLWENKIIHISDDYNDCSDYTFYHSPTEAYEAAIEYTLNNLI